jgi:hypothetical protein
MIEMNKPAKMAYFWLIPLNNTTFEGVFPSLISELSKSIFWFVFAIVLQERPKDEVNPSLIDKPNNGLNQNR